MWLWCVIHAKNIKMIIYIYMNYFRKLQYEFDDNIRNKCNVEYERLQFCLKNNKFNKSLCNDNKIIFEICINNFCDEFDKRNNLKNHNIKITF
jgi:hypothetical protein